MNKDLVAIFEYLEREKGIKREVIITAVEESLRAAARKSVKGLINVTVHINPKTGNIDVVAQKEVVDKVTIPEEEISFEEARKINPDCELGSLGRYRRHPSRFRKDRRANGASNHLTKIAQC